MKVLVVHPHLSVLGGSEELTRHLIDQLLEMGIEVAVLTRDVGSRPLKAKTWFIEGGAGEGPAKRFCDVLLSFDRLFKKFRPDVVVVMIHEPLYAVASKIVAPGTPVVIYIHFPVEEELSKEKLKEFYKFYRFPVFEPVMYRVPDVHIANSLYTARALYSMLGIEANVVYPCISKEYLEEEPDLEKPREPVILTVGRLVPQKNHKVVVEAFREVKKLVPESRLIIVGPKDPRFEDYFEELRAMVDDAKDAELVVNANKNYLIELYREAKVYVHARIGEHFGLAPLEAMSQGAVVVTHVTTGVAEVFSPEKDMVVYTGFRELVESLAKVLRMPNDQLVDMRKRVRAKTMFFSPERFAREMLGMMRMAIENRNRIVPLALRYSMPHIG